jgi:hypothetical protein
LGVAIDGNARPGTGSKLVRAEDGGDRRSGHENEHRRDLNQPTATDNGIDKPSEQREGAEKEEQHRGVPDLTLRCKKSDNEIAPEFARGDEGRR